MSKTSYQKEYRKNMTDQQKQRYREARMHKYHNMTDEQKQKDYQKKYKENMTDEQKQKYKESEKRYRKNMTDEQKQKRRDYQREYYKKYYAAKKLNNKIIDDSEKIIDDSDNENDFLLHLNNHKIFKCVLISFNVFQQT